MLPRVLVKTASVTSEVTLEARLLRATIMVFLSLSGAFLTALLAQARIPLPFTPVPVTGQVLAVLICGALLGGNGGMLSQVMYAGLGVMGFKWFAGGAAGLAVLSGPTGGYIIGFVVAAFFLGAFTERLAAARTFAGQVLLMLVAVGIIYLFGALHLALVMRLSMAETLAAGVTPFIVGDVLKVVIAALFTSAYFSSRPHPLKRDG